MLDRFSVKLVKWPLDLSAKLIDKTGRSANQVTFTGFVIGCFTVPALYFQQYQLALILILINRFCDGLDGALARRKGITDSGGFLDISLDFVFYSLVPLGFILANPEQNGIAGGFLLFSFIGTGSSFLAFAVMAGKNGIDSPVYKNKSLYYMTGLTEGTETILAFVCFCLFPSYFPVIAYIFATLCCITTYTRISAGFSTLRHFEQQEQEQENNTNPTK